MSAMSEHESASELHVENDHTVYILGAGFSVGAGLPVLRNFMTQSREALGWLKKQGREREVAALIKVLAYQQRAAAAAYRLIVDVDNVEDLFSLASSDNDDMQWEMSLAIAATLDYCAARARSRSAPPLVLHLPEPCSLRLRLPHGLQAVALENGTSHPWYAVSGTEYQMLVGGLVGLFSEANDERRTTFVSFNYDLVVEEALRACGLKVDYGIPPLRLTVDSGMSRALLILKQRTRLV
jgi:hypothetical protein